MSKPIDKVTTINLDLALRIIGVKIDKEILDKIIDIVELIEIKGDDTSLMDICQLEEEWKRYEATQINKSK